MMGGVGQLRHGVVLTYLVLAGKRTGNIKAGGATALAAGAREECVDVRAVCPGIDGFWRG